MTTIQQKETEVLATIRTNKQASLNTEYKDMLAFDDLFNIKCELGSEIRRLDYRINNQKSLMDKKAIEYKELQEINGSNITSVKASFQGQETYANQLKKIEWIIERMSYTLEILEIKKEATIDFYEAHVEKYVPYSSGQVKNLDKLNEESTKGKQWLAENISKLDAVIEGSEVIPAIIE